MEKAGEPCKLSSSLAANSVQAFPLSETVTVGKEHKQYQVDAGIMATVILDLQPFNQVNR